MRNIQNKRPRVGSRVMSLLDTSVSSVEHTLGETFSIVATGASLGRMTLEEMLIESKGELQDAKVAEALASKSRTDELVAAGLSEAEILVALDTERPRY